MSRPTNVKILMGDISPFPSPAKDGALSTLLLIPWCHGMEQAEAEKMSGRAVEIDRSATLRATPRIHHQRVESSESNMELFSTDEPDGRADETRQAGRTPGRLSAGGGN